MQWNVKIALNSNKHHLWNILQFSKNWLFGDHSDYLFENYRFFKTQTHKIHKQNFPFITLTITDGINLDCSTITYGSRANASGFFFLLCIFFYAERISSSHRSITYCANERFLGHLFLGTKKQYNPIQL